MICCPTFYTRVCSSLFEKRQLKTFVIGCLFHFSQAIWRQVRSKGLITKYNQDERFRLNLKKLIALAFVPLGDVTTAFELIADQFDEDADDLLGYFEKTWIGEPKRRGIFLYLLLNNFKRVQYS